MCCSSLVVSPRIHLKSISLLFQLPISTVSSYYKLLCLQDYLSIKGWMKCEKQSENRQATDTQLQRMQLCQWQIIFWPLSPSWYGWRFAIVTDGFLFSCILQLCDSWKPGSRWLRCSSVWKTSWLFVPLFSFHSLFTSVVYVPVSVTFSLFLHRPVCSHVFLAVFFLLSLSSVCCIRYPLQSLFPGLNQHFWSGWCLHSKVHSPAWGELLSKRATNTHIVHFNAGSCCWNRDAVCIQCHPLHLVLSHCFCHLCLIPEFIWNITWMLAVSFNLYHSLPTRFCHNNCWYLSSLLCKFSVYFVCPLLFLYPWNSFTGISSCSEIPHTM